MNKLLQFLEQRLAATRWQLEQADDLQYRLRVRLRHPASSETIDLIYNGEGSVTRISPIGATLAERQRQDLLHVLEAAVRSWNENLLTEDLPDSLVKKYVMVKEQAKKSFGEEPTFLGVDNYKVRLKVGVDALSLYHDANGLWTSFHWNSEIPKRVALSSSVELVLSEAKDARDLQTEPLHEKVLPEKRTN